MPRIPVEHVVDTTGLRRLLRRGHGLRLPVRPRHRARPASTATPWAPSGARGPGCRSTCRGPRPTRRSSAPTARWRERTCVRRSPAPEWLVTESGFDPRPRERLRDAVHGRQRLPRHPRHAGGGPPRRPLGHLPQRGLRRPRLARHRPGERPGLAGVRRVRRRRAARRPATARSSTTSAPSTCAPACSTGARCSPTPTAAAPGWRRCAAPSVADRHTCALRVEITPENHDGEITVVSAARRAAPQPGAAAGLSRRAPGSRWRPAGRSGRSPATWTGPCARRDDDVALPRDAHHCQRHHHRLRRGDHILARRRRAARFTLDDEQVAWHATFRPAGAPRCGWTRSCGSARRATSTGAASPVPERCLAGLAAAAGHGFRRHRRRQPRGVGTALGGLRLRDRRRPEQHAGCALRPLPPADRGERRRTRPSTSAPSRCPARATGGTCSGTPRS